MAREKRSEVPIQFMDTPDAMSSLLASHPGIPLDLQKYIERCLTNLDKISTKHGISLGVSLSFKILGDAHGRE